jgi:hypothetical protein
MILQEMKVSMINIFSPSNNLKDSKIEISGQIEIITHNDFSNSTHHFINFPYSHNFNYSRFNNVVIESFHEEQGRIAEIYIKRIFKIIRCSFFYVNVY